MNARANEVRALAARFALLLQQVLGVETVREIDRLNAERGDPLSCASHDYCDANMVMEQAFIEVLGHSSLDSDAPGNAQGEPDSTELWNAAWSHAATAGLAALAQVGTTPSEHAR